MKIYFDKVATAPLLILYMTVSCISNAYSFSLQAFNINGAAIGDSQQNFLRGMSPNFPAKSSRAKRTVKAPLVYSSPISCQTEDSGISRCRGKYAEMKKQVSGKHKEFVTYRDMVAEFNQKNELSFLSTITTTKHEDKKACLKALSNFYQQAASKTVKPSAIYPRNQLDIYYMKIDEQPFATRMMGKLDSAFSMVWQNTRGDWSAFYSIDFGCRDSGYMVVNETLYDKSKRSVSSLKSQVSRLKTKALKPET